MSGRRYLAGAHLHPVTDSDIYTWAQDLAKTGRLTQAVKDGLRLVRYLCNLPQGEYLQRRGILVESIRAGLLQVSGIPVGRATDRHGVEGQPQSLPGSVPNGGSLVEIEQVGAGSGAGPEQSLDKILGIQTGQACCLQED